MTPQKLSAAVLAATVSLTLFAGCSTSTPTGAKATTQSGVSSPGGTGGTGATGTPFLAPVALAASNSDSRAVAADALLDDQAMDDYSAAADVTAVVYETLDAESQGARARGKADPAATAAAKPKGDEPRPKGDDAKQPRADDKATEAARPKGGEQGDDKAGDRADKGASETAKGGRGHGALHVSKEAKDKLEAHETHAKQQATKRLEGDEAKSLKNAARGAGWVTNADGTKTKTVETDVTRTANGHTLTRHVKLAKTLNADGVLSSELADFSETLPSGVSRSSHREKTLNADGSYTVTFTSSQTFADKSTRTADWAKAIAADGTVTGTGTITWSDASGKVVKTVKVTLGGSAEATTATPEGGTAATADAAASADAGATSAASTR